MIQLTINYGYDVHSISLDEKIRDEIIKGVRVAIDGQGFHHEEDGLVVDHWIFNNSPKQIYFWLDIGGEFYAQDWWFEK